MYIEIKRKPTINIKIVINKIKKNGLIIKEIKNSKSILSAFFYLDLVVCTTNYPRGANSRARLVNLVMNIFS